MIKKVTLENLSSWSKLASQLWSTDKEELEEEFRQGAFPYEFLYDLSGQTVAFMSLSIRNDYVEGAKSSPLAYLEGIYVLEDHQQQQIARRLLEYAKKWAQEQGLDQIASDCLLNNAASQAFHQKLGFQEESRSVHYILNLEGEDDERTIF